MASYQLRTRATIVGNICNASPAGDTIGACLVLDGVLKVHGVDGYREVPLAGFFLGPGKTVLKPGDIVTAIFFPLPPQAAQGTYIKLGRNTWSDLSIVGVTAFGLSAMTARRLPVIASAWPWPRWRRSRWCPPQSRITWQPTRLVRRPSKKPPSWRRGAARPIDDVRGSARYRKAMVRPT